MPPFDEPGIGSLIQGPIDQQQGFQDPSGFQEQPQPTSNLGAQLQPQPQPNDSLRGEWDAWFTDPANRAGMMSFGLNLLSGGFGTPLQQFAHAAGQGLESAAGAATFQQQQERLDARENFRERQLAQRGQIAAANRQSREKIASDQAKARLATAGVSSKSLANKLLSGFTSTRLAARKRMDDALDPNFGLSSEEKDQIATQEAQRGMESALEFAQRNAPGVHTTGQIPGGQISPNLPSPGGPAQSPQAPPAAGEISPNSRGQLIPLDSLKGSPNFQRALELSKTPEGRQRLLERGIDPGSGPLSSTLQSAAGTLARGALRNNPLTAAPTRAAEGIGSLFGGR